MLLTFVPSTGRKYDAEHQECALAGLWSAFEDETPGGARGPAARSLRVLVRRLLLVQAPHKVG